MVHTRWMRGISSMISYSPGSFSFLMFHTRVDVWDLICDFVFPRFAIPLWYQSLPPRKVYMWSLQTFKNMACVSKKLWWKYTGMRHSQEHHFTTCNWYKLRAKFECVDALGFCECDSYIERKLYRKGAGTPREGL